MDDKKKIIKDSGRVNFGDKVENNMKLPTSEVPPPPPPPPPVKDSDEE